MKNANSTRRKLAIATWAAPQEGVIYGQLGIDATAALAHIAKLRETSGLKISITHLVGKAVALGLREAPGLNGRIHLGKFIPFDEVAFAYMVALEEGGDLAKVKVEQADRKSVVDIAQQLADEAKRLRAGKDEAFNKSKPILKLLPTWLLRPIAKLTGWLAASLGARGQTRRCAAICLRVVTSPQCAQPHSRAAMARSAARFLLTSGSGRRHSGQQRGSSRLQQSTQ